MHTILNRLEEVKTTDNNFSATIEIPGVGVRYKSTVIAELNQNEKLSLDRLNRVRAPVSKDKGAEKSVTDHEMASLFDDWAIKSSKESCGYEVGHIVRIRKKGKKRGYIEYSRPISADDCQNNVGVEVIYQKYECLHDRFSFKLGALYKISPKNLLCRVDVMIEDDVYVIDANEQDKCAMKVSKRPQSRPTDSDEGVQGSAGEVGRQNEREVDNDIVQFTETSLHVEG